MPNKYGENEANVEGRSEREELRRKEREK